MAQQRLKIAAVHSSSEESRSLVLSGSGAVLIPRGFNYENDHTNRLLEYYY